MAQFDVYQNLNADTKRSVPYLLDVQADLLSELGTRVVVPLMSTEKINKMLRHLNPLFEIDGRQFVMSASELAGVSVQILGARVLSLKHQRSAIIEALDFLFVGF